MSLLRARNGTLYELPIFLPVYHPIASPVPMELWVSEFDVEACIVNAFFLYKDRATRTAFKAGKKIQEHISFPGLVMTDSGAFQGFQGELYLKNKTIVLFQEMIGADIVSPLDLVTPPGDKRTVAEKKWKRTLIRTKEAKELLSEATLAGVQQGGRYYDIRRQCTGELLELDISYLALGSLVPFFNKNHDMGFVGTVIKDARDMCGKNMPIHVYGAGDPVELPFMAALGANVFDSSSYAHYANQGWYMTPFGATRDSGLLASGEFRCSCEYCLKNEKPEMIFEDAVMLACHNLWTIIQTMKKIREALRLDSLDNMIEDILERHMIWFPDSGLSLSWAKLHE